jgi:hypothetical protein
VWHWLGYWTGVTNEAGKGYALWSGIGSDLGIFAGVFFFYYHHTCHAKRCWRVSKHEVDGTPFKVCARHHPSVPDRGATAGHIHRLHHQHQTKGTPQ